MSKECMVTGRKPGVGNSVSHSNRKTKRRWNLNLRNKRYFLPSENRWVRLTLSVRAIKTIDKLGIEAVIAKVRRRGISV